MLVLSFNKYSVNKTNKDGEKEEGGFLIRNLELDMVWMD